MWLAKYLTNREDYSYTICRENYRYLTSFIAVSCKADNQRITEKWNYDNIRSANDH